MPRDKSKATWLQKSLVGILIIANLSLAAFVWSRHQATRRPLPNKEIPSAELLSNDLLKAEMLDLAAKSHSGKAVLVMLASASTSCSTGKLVDVLNAHAGKTQNNLLILLPNSYSQTDIDNFRINLEVPYPVERATESLSNHWLSLAKKYAVTGVVLLIDNGEISVLQDITEVDRRLLSSN